MIQKIKDIAIIAALVIAGYVAYNFFFKNPVSEKTFKEYEKEFRAEIDTLNVKIDDLSRKADSIKKSTQRLEKGQVIIYKQIKEKSNNSFYENLNLLF